MAIEKDAASVAKDTGRRSGETKEAAAEFARAAEEQRNEAAQAANSAQRVAAAGAKAALESITRTTSDASETQGAAGGTPRNASERTSRNLQAFMQAQATMAEGFQSAWREWINWQQEGMRRWPEQVQGLMRARTQQELISLQADLMRQELDELMRTGVRVSELTGRAASEAARRMTTD